MADDVLVIPPIRTDLTEGDGDASRTQKQWYMYWRGLGLQVDSLGKAIQYGTHDQRPNPDEVPPGSLYSEGSVLYQNLDDGWHYLAGTQWGTLSPDQRPTWLTQKDAGYDFRTIDTSDVYAPREFIWSGSAWVEATFLLYGTHAARPAADSLTPPRTMYSETDRGNTLYQQQANAWKYVAGTMYGTMSPDQRPTGLGANDTGFQFRSTDAPPRSFYWSGTAWVETTPPAPLSVQGTGGYALNVNYTNTFTTPLWITFSFSMASAGSQVVAYCDSSATPATPVAVVYNGVSPAMTLYVPMTIAVLPGYSFRFQTTGSVTTAASVWWH